MRNPYPLTLSEEGGMGDLGGEAPGREGGEAEPLEPFLPGMEARERLEFEALLERLFHDPSKYGFASCDEAAEAILAYKSRLASIVKKGAAAHETGAIYIDTCVRYLAKSIQRVNRQRNLLLSVAENSSEPRDFGARQVAVLDPATGEGSSSGEYEFIAGIAPSLFLEKMDPQSKRLLFLVVKCAREIDDSGLAKAARYIGVPIPWMTALVQKARLSLAAQETAIATINARANTLWLRKRLCEFRLRNEILSDEEKASLVDSYGRYKQRYEALMERRSRCRVLVPNRVIARLLGVPKGTVDSGLFYLKGSYSDRLADSRGRV